MAVCGRNKCIFRWEIRNFFYCWLKKGERLKSATFELGKSEPTRWSLILYPKGNISGDHVGVYLRREKDTSGPDIITLSFLLAIRDGSGSFLKVGNRLEHDFPIFSIFGKEEFATKDEIFGTEKETFLHRNTLIVQCTLFTNKIPITAKYYTSVTNFQDNLGSFIWNIKRFSTIMPHERNNYQILNESGKILANFHLVSGLKGEITLEITSMDENLTFFSFKIFVMDSERKMINFGTHTIVGCDIQGIKRQLISSEKLMKHKSQYLPNDALSLVCEYAFSIGSILMTCKENKFGIISSVAQIKPVENEKIPTSCENQSHQPKAILDDFKSMYNDAILSDVELRTSTQKFPTHKNILSARSPVFRRMFNNNMREKNSGHVDITDLDTDTIHRMLIFIYTDGLKDLQFESASKLYSAADKYEIIALKEKCSCFLKDNMSPTNACDLLALADTHQDADLKCAVQDYILSHDKDVFGSPEWKEFMATNLLLAADIMYRKVCPS